MPNVHTQTRLTGSRIEDLWEDNRKMKAARLARKYYWRKKDHQLANKRMVERIMKDTPQSRQNKRYSRASSRGNDGVHPVEHDDGRDAHGGHRRKGHECVRGHPGKGHACAEPAMGSHGKLPSLETPWDPTLWDGRT